MSSSEFKHLYNQKLSQKRGGIGAKNLLPLALEVAPLLLGLGLEGGCCGDGFHRHCTRLKEVYSPALGENVHRCAKYEPNAVDNVFEPPSYYKGNARSLMHEEARREGRGGVMLGGATKYSNEFHKPTKCNPWVIYLEIMRNILYRNNPEARLYITKEEVPDTGMNVTDYYYHLKQTGSLPNFIEGNLQFSKHPEKCMEYLDQYNWGRIERGGKRIARNREELAELP